MIDTASGKSSRPTMPRVPSFLNDVTAAADGRVFVSDMVNNQIWMLDGDLFELWLDNPALENPNGLLAEPDRLLVAAWGKDMNPADFSTNVPGHLKAVDYQTKAITDLGDQPIGNLDGLEPDGHGGYLATDWVAGALYRIDATGNAAMLMDLDQGSADLTTSRASSWRSSRSWAITPWSPTRSSSRQAAAGRPGRSLRARPACSAPAIRRAALPRCRRRRQLQGRSPRRSRASMSSMQGIRSAIVSTT